MIVSFKDPDARLLYETGKSRRIPATLRKAAMRKLVTLNNVDELDHLEIPPGNRLEPMKGDRTGQHSIRINDQFRVCFIWRDGNAYEVEIVDYH
nr:type II toxin-antitoxin system RelE/ParE family toxin [Candidatus Koribacter versatilis]